MSGTGGASQALTPRRLRWWWPYVSREFSTRLTPDEVLARLGGHTEPPKWYVSLGRLEPRGVLFRGRITGNTLMLTPRVIRPRVWLIPVANGNVAASGSGTDIRLRVRPHLAFAGCFAFVAAAVSLIFVLVLIASLLEGQALFALISLSILLFYGLLCFAQVRAFYREASQITRFFERIESAT